MKSLAAVNYLIRAVLPCLHFPICALLLASGVRSDMGTNGLITGHAYSLLAAVEVCVCACVSSLTCKLLKFLVCNSLHQSVSFLDGLSLKLSNIFSSFSPSVPPAVKHRQDGAGKYYFDRISTSYDCSNLSDLHYLANSWF